MGALIPILAFIPAICIVIIVHEFGHYLVARLCGVRVLRFSIGIGKVLYRFKAHPEGTEWAVSLLPLGGYVKLLDARSEDMSQYPPAEMAHEFTSKSVWQKMAVAVAGPLANFVLAVFLLAGIYMHGVPYPVAKLRAVPVDTIAYQAGLRGGDQVIGINGIAVSHWGDVQGAFADAVLSGKGSVQLRFVHDKREQDAQINIASMTADALKGDFLKGLGFSLAMGPAVLGRLEEVGEAKRAGLQEGDRVMAVDGKPIDDALGLVEVIRGSANTKCVFSVNRQGRLLDVAVDVGSRIDEKAGKVGKIGVMISFSPETVTVKYGILSSFAQGVAKTWDLTVRTVQSIVAILTGQLSVRELTGPVGIASHAGKTAQAGALAYLTFIVFISIGIGIMNLMPIPVLDGGLLLYYAVEFIKGSPVSEKVSRMWTAVGLGLLGFLMVVTFCNDISRLFP